MKFTLVLLIVSVGLASGKDFPITWKVQPYEPLSLAVGDTVTFTWKGTHGVYKIPSGECPSSFFIDNPEITKLAPEAKDGTYVLNALAPGKVWVACPMDGHCDAGQKIEITVA